MVDPILLGMFIVVFILWIRIVKSLWTLISFDRRILEFRRYVRKA